MTGALTVAQALATARAALADAGIDQPALDARLLLADATGLSRAQLIGWSERPLAAVEAQRLHAALQRRLAREPLAYILGRKEFWSLDFAVDRHVLIPRPDSETLVEAVLASVADRHQPLQILDLGTGSGCLLLALLSELPAARGIGVDRSAQALQIARQNAERLGLATRTGFVSSDWGSALAGRFDLIVANPPYVAETDWQQLMPEINRYEPRAALVAGSDGLSAYRRILPQVRRLLGDTGAIFLEIGAEQAEAVIDIAASAGFECADIRDDLVGFARCLRLCLVDAPSPNKRLGNKAFPV